MSRSSKDISFASFNLYNLQLPNLRWYWNTYTQDEYDQKIQWSASMLKRIDADVIAFQELWSKQCLEDIFAAADLADDYTLHFIDDEWYNIAVAAAVRRPWTVTPPIQLHKEFLSDVSLTKKRSNDGEDDELDITIDRFSRTIMQLAISHPDAPTLPSIQVFVAHLKSKRPTVIGSDSEVLKLHQQAIGSAISTIRRTAEAAALRVLLTKQMKHTDDPVVVLGDLNDSQLSNTLSIITQQPPFRMYESSRVGRRNDVGLYTTSIMQQMKAARDVYYTHEFNGIQEVIDHVLVSEQFYDHSQHRIWTFREMKVWNDYIEDKDTSTSDHGIVCSYFIYDPE